jgi:hypothetical protein
MTTTYNINLNDRAFVQALRHAAENYALPTSLTNRYLQAYADLAMAADRLDALIARSQTPGADNAHYSLLDKRLEETKAMLLRVMNEGYLDVGTLEHEPSCTCTPCCAKRFCNSMAGDDVPACLPPNAAMTTS